MPPKHVATAYMFISRGVCDEHQTPCFLSSSWVECTRLITQGSFSLLNQSPIYGIIQRIVWFGVMTGNRNCWPKCLQTLNHISYLPNPVFPKIISFSLHLWDASISSKTQVDDAVFRNCLLCVPVKMIFGLFSKVFTRTVLRSDSFWKVRSRTTK